MFLNSRESEVGEGGLGTEKKKIEGGQRGLKPDPI